MKPDNTPQDSALTQEVQSPTGPHSRRSIFKRALATTAAANVVGLAGTPGQTEADVAALGPDTATQRRIKAYRVRQQAALREFILPVPQHPDSGDEARNAGKIGSYSKGVPHDALGEVDLVSYQRLLIALATGRRSDFEAIPLGCATPSRQRKLVDPQSGLAFDLEGADSHALAIPPAPRFDSAEEAGEIVENYWMALLRDVPFTEYETNPLALAAAADLSSMSDFRGPKEGGGGDEEPDDETNSDGGQVDPGHAVKAPVGSFPVNRHCNSPDCEPGFAEVGGQCHGKADGSKDECSNRIEVNMKPEPGNHPVSLLAAALFALGVMACQASAANPAAIGREVAIPAHLQDGEEYQLPVKKLVAHGQKLFAANWTIDEGAGRPLTKGTGNPLADLASPLVFPRNFNRISAPDANSCAGCHNAPFGVVGGGGDFVANVAVLAQRFDFASFDVLDLIMTRGMVDESGKRATLQNIANSRATLGMFGSGFIEMLARQMTADLQTLRDATPPGGATALESKGVSFGTIRRAADGTWDTSQVEGIPATSLGSAGPGSPPSLVIRPFHQAGRVVSIREFSNNAFNHHHGIQSSERFGVGTDRDGDGFVNEMTRADVTAASIFQATMAVPGRVIPKDRAVEAAVWEGERRFDAIGCAKCHVPSLPLDNKGWIFSEPNPYNPPGNLRPGEAAPVKVDLTSADLPWPRLKPKNDVVHVPAYTDLKLHDITSGPGDPNIEPLDMQQPNGSAGFFDGNSKFITRKLWGCANEPPYFHHGQFTTLREAILAHAGEALASRQAFESLPSDGQNALIEFLKSLQVLPRNSRHLIVDEKGLPRIWPPKAHEDED